MTEPSSLYAGQAEIDLSAFAKNLAALQAHAPQAEPLAIVKADAYGHEAKLIAKAAWDQGVRWLGQAQVQEALNLHAYFDQIGLPSCHEANGPRIFTWIFPSGANGVKARKAAIAAGLDISVSNTFELDELLLAYHDLLAEDEATKKPARVHLKIDVGNSRAGATKEHWPELVAATKAAVETGIVSLEGIWSHLQSADDPAPEAIAETNQQIDNFEAAIEVAKAAGLSPVRRHLSATSGGLWHPRAHFDMIRWGIGLYGYSPNPAHPGSPTDLTPVMTLAAPLMSVKQIPAGQGVSYNATWRAERATWVGLVPLGYADGISRLQSNTAWVTVYHEGEAIPARIIGRVCMDQFMIDLGHGEQPRAARGDRVVLFGGEQKAANADDWAKTAQTISYEILTSIGARVPRVPTLTK
ncbi:alanine racemase [Boudabousia tangfeifanii]|uniref:Alanine racemase n=1 Tax=Boudabousia tangfeifanii TaxID=1912795 RepID=A0A1D9MJA0_9ACTO|nr:alanine racemase [Boudabousia tangfeifanii]AOZ72259.1 alanine racemase [Boudabousia tangfeifanii]